MDAADSETTAYFAFEIAGNVELISSRQIINKKFYQSVHRAGGAKSYASNVVKSLRTDTYNDTLMHKKTCNRLLNNQLQVLVSRCFATII